MWIFASYIDKPPHPLRYASQVLRMLPAPARFVLRYATAKASYETPNFEKMQFAVQCSKAVAYLHMRKRGCSVSKIV